MYVTLFSCHNCTKHLICAGIKKVIYVEPYPKSFAEELHGDAILIKNPNECDEKNKVSFEPFIGISGRRYFDLFSLDWGSGDRIKRMDDDTGKLMKWEPKKAEFRFKIASKSHEFNEKNAIEELKKAKEKIKNYK
jgi:deoxycytidylate deaminase